MRPRVHLEGMGFLGSYLAWRLDQAGIPFTWEDRNSDITAWRASTGSVYPSGDPVEWACYMQWRASLLTAPDAVSLYLAAVPYWYTSKGAPHGGRWPAARDLGYIRQHGVWSIHVNVQSWVRATRRALAERRVPAPPDAVRVIAHGFSARLAGYVWGWSRRVRLRYDTDTFGPRACFYCREGRFKLAYAYPVPGEPDTWYAGSSMIPQKAARPLEVDSKYQRWLEDFTRLTHGNVEVEPRADIVQGWRPKPAAGDDDLLRPVGGALVVRPMGASGVRLAPAVGDELLGVLA